MTPTLPKEIRENIARAKGYLRRDELSRAMETMGLALREGSNAQMPRAGRFEMEVHFEEFLTELVRHPMMQPLLDPQGTGKPRTIPYQRGKEGVLATVLEGLGKMLQQAAAEEEKKSREQDLLRQKELMSTGVSAIMRGDIARGRAFLKRAAVEFGAQPGIYAKVGQLFAAVEQHVDAAEMFEKAIEQDAKDVESYSNAVTSYMNALEFQKAEDVFRKILRQFGGSPRIYGRMAQLYLAWQKRTRAEEFALRAIQLDAEQPEAQEVLEKIQRRTH